MPTKLQACEQIAEKTAKQITASHESWTDFLKTAARLYKYPYHEQLMIYAQRPEATACAEYGLWNERMRQWVKRGSRGIALIDNTGSRPRLRYVFDVADTGGNEKSRRPFLWELKPEHEAPVSKALADAFVVPAKENLSDQLQDIAARLAAEYAHDNLHEILYTVDGSFLEGYRHKAYYSLDRGDGIEKDILFVSLSPGEIYERKVTTEQLHAAIASLPDKQAKRIYAYYFLGLSKAAIARSEGVSRNQISRSINKALQRMKKSLKNSI